MHIDLADKYFWIVFAELLLSFTASVAYINRGWFGTDFGEIPEYPDDYIDQYDGGEQTEVTENHAPESTTTLTIESESTTFMTPTTTIDITTESEPTASVTLTPMIATESEPTAIVETTSESESTTSVVPTTSITTESETATVTETTTETKSPTPTAPTTTATTESESTTFITPTTTIETTTESESTTSTATTTAATTESESTTFEPPTTIIETTIEDRPDLDTREFLPNTTIQHEMDSEIIGVLLPAAFPPTLFRVHSYFHDVPLPMAPYLTLVCTAMILYFGGGALVIVERGSGIVSGCAWGVAICLTADLLVTIIDRTKDQAKGSQEKSAEPREGAEGPVSTIRPPPATPVEQQQLERQPSSPKGRMSWWRRSGGDNPPSLVPAQPTSQAQQHIQPTTPESSSIHRRAGTGTNPSQQHQTSSSSLSAPPSTPYPSRPPSTAEGAVRPGPRRPPNKSI